MDTAQLPVVCSKAAGFDYKDTKNKETLQAFSGRRVLFCTILYFSVLFVGSLESFLCLCIYYEAYRITHQEDTESELFPRRRPPSCLAKAEDAFVKKKID